MRREWIYMTAVSLLALASSGLWLYGQPPAAGQPFEATVLLVEGSVEVKLPGEADWRSAQVDMKLPADTTISTGVKSKVGLDFDGHAVVTIRRPSVVRLDRCLVTETAVETRLQVKVGSLQAGVVKERLASDFKITTPVVTLSVRGTEIADVTHSERGTEVLMGREGLLDMTKYFSPLGLTRHLGPGDHCDSLLFLLPVDDRKLGRTWRSYLYGRSDAENGSAKWDPNDLSDARGEFTREAGNPQFQRILMQESPEYVEEEIPGG